MMLEKDFVKRLKELLNIKQEVEVNPDTAIIDRQQAIIKLTAEFWKELGFNNVAGLLNDSIST